MKKIKNLYLRLGANWRSLILFFFLALVWFLLFVIVNNLFLQKPFVISTNQEYFIQAEKTWGVDFTSFRLPGHFNLWFSFVWAFLAFVFLKLTILEGHQLISLPAINLFATLVGIFCSFWWGSIFFGLLTYLAFIFIYFSIIIALETLDFIWSMLFPD